MCNNYAFKLKQKRNTNETLFSNNIRHATKTLQEPQYNSTYSALPAARVGVDVSDGKRTGSGRLTSSSKSPASDSV